MFQSPSLRGSGRFGVTPATTTATCPLVSIPFIAGQWSLQHHRRPSIRHARVSIPFIAGQWSLPYTLSIAPTLDALFQSPSLRGSGRFRRAARASADVAEFQSPSLRGSGRFRLDDVVLIVDILFQSPSLRGSGRFI